LRFNALAEANMRAAREMRVIDATVIEPSAAEPIDIFEN